MMSTVGNLSTRRIAEIIARETWEHSASSAMVQPNHCIRSRSVTASPAQIWQRPFSWQRAKI
jgi:hypothetical protein